MPFTATFPRQMNVWKRCWLIKIELEMIYLATIVAQHVELCERLT